MTSKYKIIVCALKNYNLNSREFQVRIFLLNLDLITQPNRYDISSIFLQVLCVLNNIYDTSETRTCNNP